MISLLAAIPLFFGWMTEQMLYDKQQAQTQGTLPSKEIQSSSTPSNSPFEPANDQDGTVDGPDTSTNNSGTIKTNTANQQGIYWLALLDQKQYGPSYLAAASLLKDIISQEQWVAAMKGTRSPLGSTRSRKLAKTEQLQQLPAGTKGTFTRLTYQTQFSEGNVTEVLILIGGGARGTREEWKVVSYQTHK